ncbi:MAG: hypothetical protein JWP11_3406 [Frankiales bacterium]|nr:hypothetical protein [Frankiales bacterium]
MSGQVDPTDNLRDAVAYARALSSNDMAAARRIAKDADPRLLLPGVGILLVSAVRRDAARRGVEVQVAWDQLLAGVERLRPPA